jgi:hypothetical protein
VPPIGGINVTASGHCATQRAIASKIERRPTNPPCRPAKAHQIKCEPRRDCRHGNKCCQR